MKTVCIVGAGPAGLVAAKTFLQTGKVDISVYEKNSRIGGIWALDQNSTGGFLSPYTPTNLSRFTVGFSDLDWKSVDFHSDQANGVQNGASEGIHLPMFPKAWMANRYLETYRKKYIPDEVIKCNHQVVKAARDSDKWTITIKDEQSRETSRQFDYLIMASGFFASPRLMKRNVPDLTTAELPIEIIHSSTFRSLNNLLPEGKDVSGKTILMFGGGNSSGETAASVALQLSNAQWSPDTSSANRFKDCKIVHVTPRPLYALPHFHEHEEGSRSYIPLDFRLYDFGRRPRGLGSYAGRQSKEVRNIVHGAIQSMVGSDQSDLSEALVSRKGEGRGSGYVAITESYAEYVRSGLIEVVSGRVTGLSTGKDGFASATVKKGEEELQYDDIAAVIYATGFTPEPALDMLDDSTKAAVKHDTNSLRLPMILEQWQTMSRDAPSVSFLGFYEGPYWPMMEMQARLTAERWMSDKIAERRSYEMDEELLKLRRGMQDRDIDVPQFWFSDYLGYLEDIASELNLERNDNGFEERGGCVSPARYVSPQTNRVEADAIVEGLHKIWQDCTVNGKYVPRAAMRAMQGHWNINRRIESARSTFPSGTLEGTASFHPRMPTLDKSGTTFDLEYLYVESGTFTTTTGFSMTASRRYVYRYSEAEDSLSVWFVKPDNNLEVDYLFHNLEFVKPKEARKAGASVAKADHLCVDDMYWTEYRLPLKGVTLPEFEIKHTVKGPDKDYVATTRYQRQRK
ncbi:hypothetical protein LTR37_009749 [Vermiconidia calcicola]|uniref:Uncharacterized protein n=1 Tax=Vermiconidia calcicola TaxID=1690605 RepID=A0ACC3N8C9_9PEZI|nr:hypothetical protein LTR37_009749 [Vermiconidia calcicola]